MLQVEKWLKRAFLPGMRTFQPSAVAIVLTSPGELPRKMALATCKGYQTVTLLHDLIACQDMPRSRADVPQDIACGSTGIFHVPSQ